MTDRAPRRSALAAMCAASSARQSARIAVSNASMSNPVDAMETRQHDGARSDDAAFLVACARASGIDRTFCESAVSACAPASVAAMTNADAGGIRACIKRCAIRAARDRAGECCDDVVIRCAGKARGGGFAANAAMLKR
jgi:hypothetical protein